MKKQYQPGELRSTDGPRSPIYDGGEGGIRTREKFAPLRDFQSRPFVHSGTSPAQMGDVLKPLRCENNQRLNVDDI